MTSGPAFAGGPTSALLSVPGEGRTASLYYTDPEYDALAGLVGANTDLAGEEDRSGGGHENGPGITVTWLIHDVSPWRVDRIYPNGEGAPWIATQVAVGEGTIWESPVVWHQPQGGVQLMALLDKLGVGEAARAADDFRGVAGAPAPRPGQTPADTPEPADSSALGGIWWALGGLVAGVLAATLGGRLRRSHAVDDDAPPAHDPADTDAGTLGPEELSWPAPQP
jgi:hypothetical protein